MILSMVEPRSLSQLLPGQIATISAIDAEDQVRERMAALGLRRGRLISVVRRARMNGPIQIRVGTTDLMIRRVEAAKVQLLQAATVS